MCNIYLLENKEIYLNTKSLRHDAMVTKCLPNNQMIVEIARTSACASCDMNGTCGTNEESPKNEFIVPNHVSAKVGDLVSISIQHRQLYKSAFLVYILPLIIMLAGAIATKIVFSKDIYAAIISLVILALYFVGLKLIMDKKSDTISVSLRY